jgi:hypothetical protein
MCKFSSFFLLGVVNFVFFVLGGALTGIAVAALESHSKLFDELPHKADAAFYAFVAAGALLMLVSVFGFIGMCTYKRSGGRCILGVYASLMVILILIEVATALAVLLLLGKLNKVDDSDLGQSIERELNTSIHNIYDDCCVAPAGHNDTITTDLHQRCTWLHDVDDADCGAFGTFRSAVISELRKSLQPATWVALGLAVTQLLTLVATCYLQCRGRTEQRKAERDADPYGYSALAAGEASDGTYGGYVGSSYRQPGAAATGVQPARGAYIAFS